MARQGDKYHAKGLTKKEYGKKYYQEHKENYRAYGRKWSKEHPEQEKARWKKYRTEHQEERRALGRKIRQQLRQEALIYYGGNPPKCACCGEIIIEFLTIDHIGGGGHKHSQKIGGSGNLYRWLKKNDYPLGFRVLCYNCNSCLGHYGYCPHQREGTDG